MPFIAACSFCEQKLKLPDQALGQSRECPRCHNWFTAFETTHLPNAEESGRQKTKKKRSGSPTSNTTRASPPVTPLETTTSIQEEYERWREAAVRPPAAAETTDDVRTLRTERSEPVRIPTSPPAAPSVVSVAAARDRRRRWTTSSVLAIFCASSALLVAAVPSVLALFSGSNAVVIAWSPYVNLLALPLAAVAVGSGVFGLLTFETRSLWSKGFCLAGGVLGTGLIIGLGLWPLLFGPHVSAEPTHTSQPGVVPFGAGGAAIPGEWLNASTGRVVHDDLRVRFTDIAVEFVEIKGLDPKKQPKDPSLAIRFRLSNGGFHRRIPYESWAEKNPPTLTDDAGRRYNLRDFGPGAEVAGHIHTASVAPSKAVDDVLVFEAPSAKIEYLHLELPAAAYGSEGVLRVLIPKSMIRR
jgi:hypothetical protein